VVGVAHERAEALEQGGLLDAVHGQGGGDAGSSAAGAAAAAAAAAVPDVSELDLGMSVRPVAAADFDRAIARMKASVDEEGIELRRVQEWNLKYGELKTSRGKKKSAQQLSLYI